MTKQWLIKQHDPANGEFYLLRPRGPWLSWGSKAEAQRFATRREALKRLGEIRPNRIAHAQIEAA